MAIFTYRLNTPSVTIPSPPDNAYVSTLRTDHDGEITSVSMAIYGLTHGYAGDLDIMLAQSDYTDLRYLQVMSDVRASDEIDNATLVFADSASEVLALSSTDEPVESGTYRPFGTAGETLFNYDDTAAAIPLATATGDGVVSFATVFDDRRATSIWSLYARDDLGGFAGEFLAWSLTIGTSTSQGRIVTDTGSSNQQIIFAAGSGATGSYLQGSNLEVSYSGVSDWSISTSNGNDVVVASTLNDFVQSFSGNDLVYGGDGADRLTGGRDRDSVYGGAGNDVIILLGQQSLTDLAAQEVMDGGAGVDELEFISTVGNEVFDLRSSLLSGFERLELSGYSAIPPITVRLLDTQFGPGLSTTAVIDFGAPSTNRVINFQMSSQTTLNLSGLTFLNYNPNTTSRIEVTGDSSAETMIGSSITDWLVGNSGDDMLFGGSGNDVLQGGGGNDNLWGSFGADEHIGGGGSGVDYARYDDANYGNLMIRLDNAALNTGTVAVGDTYSAIEGLVGGVGNDTVVGDGLGNFLFGSGGNDLVYGGIGNDYLNGGAGGDNLWGGFGADQHVGGDDAGVDYARYDDAVFGNLTISLLSPATNTGGAAGDTYFGIEGLVGGAGNDVVVGDALANFLFGSGGNDFIDGREGNDYLNGGAGADDFRFATAIGAANVDTIADFQAGVDDILLAQAIFSAIGVTLDATEFRIGAAVDGNDFLLYNSATGALTYDTNGNGAGGATQIATLSAGLALTIADFVMV